MHAHTHTHKRRQENVKLSKRTEKAGEKEQGTDRGTDTNMSTCLHGEVVSTNRRSGKRLVRVGYLHVRDGLQPLLVFWLLLLEVLHQVLNVGADLPEVQVQVLTRERRARERKRERERERERERGRGRKNRISLFRGQGRVR